MASRGNKERKAYLVKQKLVDCPFCPYHRVENDHHNRKKRTDHHKNKDRRTIRGRF